MKEFKRRFDPVETKGEGPRRLKNLYFLYLIELRALSKVAPYFERSIVDLYTGYTLYIVVIQSCSTLCNPAGYTLPGSSVHGIIQARVLEWVTISLSRGSSQPRD